MSASNHPSAVFFVFDIQIYPELSERRCADPWKDAGLSTTYTQWNGCMVEINSRKIPEANVQVRVNLFE